jgi:hypothetical protein
VLGLLCEISDFAGVDCMPMGDMMNAGDLHAHKKEAKIGYCAIVCKQKSELVDPTSFCPQKLSRVTGLERGQV